MVGRSLVYHQSMTPAQHSEGFWERPGLNALVAVVVVSAALAVLFATEQNAVSEGGLAITSKSRQAFGSLSALSGAAASTAERSSGTLTAAADRANGSGAEPSSLLYAPNQYTFVLTGEVPAVGDSELPVYKRVADPNFLTGTSLGDSARLNLGSFPGLAVQQLTLKDEQGYSIMLDMVQGSIYIADSSSSATVSEPLKEGQLLSADEAIAIARQFLSDKGVALEGYGEPELREQYDWSTMAATGGVAMPEMGFYNEYQEVLFPLQVNGKNLLYVSGEPAGIAVSVSARTKRVYSVAGITSRTYEQSLYPVEQDTNKIKSSAEQGGYYGRYYYAAERGGEPVQSGGRISIKLGIPEQRYVSFSTYDEKGESVYFIPAYLFPVLDPPSGYTQKWVTVPLVPELLESVGPSDLPVPVPLKGADAVAPASGASTANTGTAL